MKTMNKKGIVLVTILLLIGTTVLPTITSGSIEEIGIQRYDSVSAASNTDQELDLLHGETFFNITGVSEDINSFNFTYTIPPNYENQAPIFFDIRDDTTTKIINYSMSNDTNQPNKVVTLEMGPIKKGENAFLHFDFWVLVKNNDYEDLPEYVEIPAEEELPEDTKIWLASTKAIQANNTLIKLKAKQLLRRSDNNLLNLANNIVLFTLKSGFYLRKFHLVPIVYNFLDFLFKNRITPGEWARYNDALSKLLFRIGSCTGDANLGTALFRANGIPAKDLIVMPANGYWYNIHYICEYYCPSYGWVLAETSQAITPYMPKNVIIIRVNYPEDEDLAGTGFDYYGGCEQWYWKDNKNIVGYVRTKAFNNKELTTTSSNAIISFKATQKIWEKFTQYAGLPLSGENKNHFDNATKAQENAINCFLQSNIDGYMENITYAYDEYKKIII